MKTHCFAIVGLLAASLVTHSVTVAQNAGGEDGAKNSLTMKTERAIIFKDGFCLIVKQATGRTDENGDLVTDEVPDEAILGSFWAVPENANLNSMVASWIETEKTEKEQQDCSTMAELIKANQGRECSFQLPDDQNLQGTILKFLSRPEPAASRERSARMLASSSSGAWLNRQITTAGGDIFILRTDSGDMAIKIDEVRNLRIEQMEVTINRIEETQQRHKRLTFRTDRPNADVKLKIMYFRPGIRWIPTYRIQLTNQRFGNGDDRMKTAELTMQGEVVNEAEDLVDVPIHLVVGVPNFRFKGVASPMVLESKLRNVLQQAAPQLMSQQVQFSNAIMPPSSNDPGAAGGGGEVTLPATLDGSQAGNDLFVYKLKSTTIRKGERAGVSILSSTVGYRDVHTWEVTVPHTESHSPAGNQNSPLQLSENKVWRQIELVNSTKYPWTTGAAMFVDGDMPLAQELLTYTSPGGQTRVPVTIAVDVRGRLSDAETGREMNAVQWRGYEYAKVSGATSLMVFNRKSEPIELELTMRTGGKATSASDNGAIRLTPFRAEDWQQGGDPINNSSRIQWKTTIEPGESFSPKTDYEYLLRY